MPVSELKGRQGQATENSFLRRLYYARNYSSEVAAIDAVYDFLVSQLGDPPTLAANELRSIAANEGDVLNSYLCEAQWGPYQKRTPPQVGESQFNFEIAGTQTKVIVALNNTVYKRSGDGLSLPVIHTIGDQGMGEPPSGCDIFEPISSFSITKWIPLQDLTESYATQIENCVGKWNASTFRGRPAGEVLFMGVSGSQRGAADAEVTFKFMVRKNRSTPFSVAGIEISQKRGWDYLWPRYRIDYTEDGSSSITNEVTHMVVSQVMESAEFDVLGVSS